MSDNVHRTKEAYNLITQYVDGEFELGDAERLLELLQNDPELDQTLYENLHTDFLLRQGIMADKARALVDLFEETPNKPTNQEESSFFDGMVQYEKNSPSLLPPWTPPPEEPSPFWTSLKKLRQSRWLPSARIVLASVIIFLFVGVVFETLRMAWHIPNVEWKPIARIVESIDARWDESQGPFKIGEELGPNKLFLKSGIVQIEFFSGAKVVLEGPAIFVLNGKNKSFCQLGKISAEVPPSAKGFEVTTPFSTVVDLGTEFSLEVTEHSAEVHVIKGSVEVNRISTPVLKLVDGWAARLTSKGETEKKEADPKTFLSEASVHRQALEYRKEIKEKQEIVDEKTALDPALLFRLSHSDQSRCPANIIGCLRENGFLPDQIAYRFEKHSDRIELSLPEQLQDMTLVAVIHLDKLTHFSNTLLLCRSFYDTPDTFLWQINQFGDVQFHFRNESGLENFDAPALITRKDWNTRFTLAVVVDSEKNEIRHYKDGVFVATIPWESARPIHAGEASIGNEFPDRKKKSSRYLNGSVENFLIFSKALQDSEISELFYK